MISFLQPYIPHYRQDFFQDLNKNCPISVYCYDDSDEIANNNFHHSSVPHAKIKSLSWKGFVIYNPFTLLKKKYTTMVLMLHFGHLTTWFLLLTKPFHRKKIILWGHGISIKRYLKEEKKPSFLLKLMVTLADCTWFYTEAELQLWKKAFPQIKAIFLGNTISDVDDILSHTIQNKTSLKEQYKIKQETIFIFCARFNTPHRRIDLLLEIINRSDKEKHGFIVIGEGRLKPDFKIYSNVYDFGSVYDTQLKKELFSISDIYLQPGWVGLSIVEGMAYGKPIFTFRRSGDTLQCVEYSYIEEDFNGKIFNSIDEFSEKIELITNQDIKLMGRNAHQFVSAKLRMKHMVENAQKSLALFYNK